MFSGISGFRITDVAERQIAEREPHDVVPTDPLVGLAAFVDAVRLEEPPVQVAEGHLGDVLDDHVLEVRERHVGEDPATRLDVTRDGERVPEGLSQALLQQQLHLRCIRVADAVEQRGIGLHPVAAPGAQLVGPGGDRGFADQGARRDIASALDEATVEPVPGFDLGLEVVVGTEEFLFGVHQLRGHGVSIPSGAGGFFGVQDEGRVSEAGRSAASSRRAREKPTRADGRAPAAR